jgi:hypothetical protein
MYEGILTQFVCKRLDKHVVSTSDSKHSLGNQEERRLFHRQTPKSHRIVHPLEAHAPVIFLFSLLAK